MPLLSRIGRSLAALALLALPSVASAQACVGLPSGGRGMLSYGFEGTDGAVGQGLGFAYHTPRAAVLLQHRWLEGYTLVDELRTSEVQGSLRIPGTRVPVCVTGGAQWTSYDNDRLESESWTASDPGYKTERHRLGGPYRRLRIPLGVAVGHEIRVGERLSLTPFLAPGLVYEQETYAPEVGPEEARQTLGWRASGGLSAALNWLVVRSTVSHTLTREYALSSQHNFLELSIQAGVRF